MAGSSNVFFKLPISPIPCSGAKTLDACHYFWLWKNHDHPSRCDTGATKLRAGCDECKYDAPTAGRFLGIQSCTQYACYQFAKRCGVKLVHFAPYHQVAQVKHVGVIGFVLSIYPRRCLSNTPITVLRYPYAFAGSGMGVADATDLRSVGSSSNRVA